VVRSITTISCRLGCGFQELFQLLQRKENQIEAKNPSIGIDNQVIILEDLNVSGMVKNRKLSRAISQQGWYEFRTLCEAKSEKFGREFKVISRWEPTSQVCSDCGFKWGKIDLSIRSILCLSCGTEQDRDENAARNIVQVGMGNRHDSKWTLRDCKTTSVARPDEASRITVRDGR
ncbi:RNA-guided endonuclease InsQ/TnpB family protein, partial [Tychonema sp. BBK16]|uniref:RNA-guided endonuclease InsQ/TnpB family protein n=1 Tax=Tychonema sp. BBK16 TaxID=2699888 RepID=UPI0038D2E21C